MPDHLWSGLKHSQLTYRRQDLAAADFNVTYEFLGGMGDAVPYEVISQRVYGLLREFGVQRLGCESIRIVD